MRRKVCRAKLRSDDALVAAALINNEGKRKNKNKMKNLMVMAVSATMAVAASAATVTWGTDTTYAPKDSTGVFGSTTISSAGSNQKMYVWVLHDIADGATAAEQFDALTAEGIYSTYASKTATADYAKAVNMSKFTQQSGDSYSIGDTVYAAIIMTYTDANGKDWYIANKASGTIGDAGGGTALSPSIGTLSTKWGGSNGDPFAGSGTAITGWTAASAVPEPTSGLLLLLGVAGLALKRKRV